jgi:hypothetical protein
MVPKPINSFDLTSKDFLERNNIQNGALAILHNMKISASNNNNVKKL